MAISTSRHGRPGHADSPVWQCGRIRPPTWPACFQGLTGTKFYMNQRFLPGPFRRTSRDSALLILSLLGLGAVGLELRSAAADWLQFRGPSGGIADTSELPTKLASSDHVAWKSELPGQGLSSPILVGDRVFIT